MSTKEYTKELKEKAFKLIEFYRQHPIVAAKDLLGVELAPIQEFLLYNIWFKNYVILVAGRGCGKALPNGTPVRTLAGWTEIQNLKIGDKVYGSDGKLATVTMVSSSDNLNFYTIKFNDGRSIECCEDHLWLVKDQSRCIDRGVDPGYEVKSTKDLFKDYKKSKYAKYSIPNNKPLMSEPPLVFTVNPFLLGVLVGVGYKPGSTFSNLDAITRRHISNVLPAGYKLIKNGGSWYIESENSEISFDDLLKQQSILSEDGILTIPEIYMFCAHHQRYQLYEGILATYYNSTPGSDIILCYRKSLEPFLEFITELLSSLGIQSRIDRKRQELYIYEKSEYTTRIVSIKKHSTGSGSCIKVDNDDHTYITKSYIVTHNSFIQGVNAALTCLLYPGKRVGLIGSSFRQAKVVFNEVDRLYQLSPILRQACERKPIMGTDMCLLRFKPAGRYSGTRIAAIPLGADGGKIRGERFHIIAADEFAQIPEQIFNLVIKPMAATASDPMERVKKLQRAKELRRLGIEPEDDDEIANKIIMSSSGYYKFNHMWDRMKYYWSRISDGDKRYGVFQIPYWFMPEGFLDETNIEEAKATLPGTLFKMEYCGLMVDDTDGFYKASLLEEVTANSIADYRTVMLKGNPDKEYVMAIDPARERDSFAILIFEIYGGNKAQIVYAKTYNQVSSIRTSKAIFKLRDNFNLIRIIMDSQGGGTNIRDLLEEGIDNNRPILNIGDRRNFGKDGDMILELFNPSPKINTAANYTALSMLEHKRVWFPAPPTGSRSGDRLDKIYETVEELKRQIVGITATPLGGGYLSFNTAVPKAKKDLYSCFIMGCHKINELYKAANLPQEQEDLLEFGGLLNKRDVDTGFYGDGYVPRSRPLIIPGV